MSVVILCGIVDDCSDGSVVIVLCSSVSELRISDENVVCVGRAFVDNVLCYFYFVSSYETSISWLKLCG